MSIYDEMEKDFQAAGQPQRKVGLLNMPATADPSVEDMENEMAQMGYQPTNDNDSWLKVLGRIPLMAAGNTISNIGRFMAYGGKPDWMTDEEYDIWNKLPAEDRKNLTAQDWVNAYRSGDPEAPRPIEGATGPWSHEINKGVMEYGEKLARENTGNYTPYTAKSFAQGVGGLLPSIAEMALMKRTGMFSPTPLQEAGATMMGLKAGNLVSKIPVNAITRNADKVGLFTTNLAKNAMLSQVEAVPESLLEQNDAVQDYIERAKYNGTYVAGKTEQEAMEVGRKVYSDNILLNTVGDSIQNALMDQIGQGNGSVRSKLIKGMLLNAPVGGFTEGMQGIIPKNAAGEEWNFTDPDIGEAALIGAVTGGAPGAINIGLDYAQGKYADRQVAKNIRNMGEGQELTDEEMQSVNGIRAMGGDDGNPPKTPPATPGTLEAVEEMQRNSGTPSFEYTRDSRWVKNNDSVSVDNLQDITKAGIGDISTAFMELTGNPMIITSGTDGAGALHMDGTYSHGTGYKIDVSGNGLEDPEIRHAFIEYCESRGITVLDEYEHPSPNSTGGHLDLEFHNYNGTGSVDEYSGPVNAAVQIQQEYTTPAGASAVENTDLTGQSFLDNEEEPLFPVDQQPQKNLAVDNTEPADNEELARRAAGDIPYEAEPIPVNRSNVSYPQYQQRQAKASTTENAPHITSTYNPKYLNNLQQQVKAVNTAELTQIARQFANFPEQHPARRIVMDELGNRINAANQQSRAIGNEQQATNYPLPQQQEQQREKTGKESQATPPPNPFIQQLANGYDGDVNALRQAISNGKAQTQQELAQGNITQQQAQEYEKRLNDTYFSLLPLVEARRKEKAIAQTAKAAGIKKKDLPRLLDTARGARKGNPKDLKTFNGFLPKIKQALDDILDGNVGRNITTATQHQNTQGTTTMPQNNIPVSNVPAGNTPAAQAENSNTTAQNTATMQQADAVPSANGSANNVSAGQTATNTPINSGERSNTNGKTQLQKPETSENRNQNQNAESGQTPEQKGNDGEAGKKQGENVEKNESKHFNTREYDTGKRTKYIAEIKADNQKDYELKYNNKHAGLHAKLRELAQRHGTISRENDMLASNSFSFADEASRDAFLKDAEKLVDDYISDKAAAEKEEPKQKAEPPKNETREEKAERLINEAFEDEEERDMAMACFFDNMQNPLQALVEKRRSLQGQFDDLVQRAYNALAKTLPKDKNGKPTGAGVDLIRKVDDTGYVRDSKNPLWYRNDYKNGEKTPYSKKNMMNTAQEMVLGERKDMGDQEALMEYDASIKELQPMFDANRQMYDDIETLNAIEPKLKEIQKELDGGKRETKTAKPANETKKAEPKPEAKEIPAKKDINGYKNEIQDAVKSMTFTQAKADELLKEYNNLLDNMVARNEITKAEAEAVRYSMEDAVKRGIILNEGRKLLKPEVRDWLDNHPFSYDKSKSREENIAAAQAIKDEFIEKFGISDTSDSGNMQITPERIALRKKIVDYLYNVGAEKRRCERKATLAIGYPAAGKSTVTKDLTDNKGYLLIDADEAKKLLPEFHGGVLADIVHDESSDLSKTLFDIALDEGDNLCWPTIGGKYESLKKKISKLHNEGLKDEKTGKIVKRVDKSGKVLPPYEVTLSYVDVPADEALKRIYNRFEETGRFDNPQNIHNLMLQTPEGNVTIQLPEGKRKERLGPTETIAVDNMILKNYLKIKDEKGVERYEWIDNGLSVDASFGEKLREAGELQSGSDGRHISGTGEGGSGIRSGDNGRESSETQEVNNTNTETDSTQDEGAISLPENETETPVTEAEVPETLREKSAVPKEKIEDFGQKIGGARKDMYVDIGLGEKTAKPKAERKPDDGLKDRKWLRDYDVKQDETGKWTVTHKPSENIRKGTADWIINVYGGAKKRKIETMTFDSKEEAEKAIAVDAVSEKHRLFLRGSGENAGYYIARRIGGKKDGHWFTLKEGFKTQEEAMVFMATHAEEILNIRTSFGEADLPRPNIVGWNDARNGKAPQRLKENQNATAEMFTDKFGFRGVQFGNWENQIERQSVMNATYEGLLDLADILGVDPKIISLNGELGLAFGARGQGLSGAVAHYEPGYTVINLTKMKGAGALAHEWFHALDHYLMIKGGIISNERRADGRLTASNQNTHASDNDYQLIRSDLNQSLKDAFKKLKDTAFYKAVVETKDETDAANWEQRARKTLDEELNKLRAYLAKDRKYGSKKKAATEEQLKRFDELATKLAAADEQQEWDWNYQTHVFPTMRKMSELFKEITGRALLKKDPSDDYIRLNYSIRNLQVRKETLADAQAKKEFTKMVPSEYSRNNTTIDRGRSTEYWTKPTEMLARAFSSYVEDSAQAKGYTSDFLSYGSDNNLVMFGRPFPEGEERKAINKAFGDFFKEVQKEIAQNKKDTGKIRFSIRAAAKEKMTGDERYQAAYHGSPHVFDTFSVDHIGSGEGAQVHGWGLYFAQDRNVAENYRKKLTNRAEPLVIEIGGVKYETSLRGKFWRFYNENRYVGNDALELALNRIRVAGGNIDNAIRNAKNNLAIYEGSPSEKIYREEVKLLEENRDNIKAETPGSLIESDIPEDNVLLDEQKQFVDQPKKVQTAIRKLWKSIGYNTNALRVMAGQEIYKTLSSELGSPQKASLALNDVGVKGITYEGGIDGRCFVIFDDAAIQIMQRYESAARAHGAEIKRSVDAIVNEVKDAYPGAKNFKMEGNDISFTMPNGVNLQVNIKDQIIVDGRDAEKARADHGLTDPDTDIVVEGYTRKLDDGDFMALSQESSEGTAYHEAMHTVRDWVLTDKENRDLETYYKKIADKQGIDVEEAIADGYRDWKLARAKGSGTLFGKLYKKMMDFIDTVRAIFKGMYNVHKIYEQIESGDVWNRDANGRFVKNPNSLSGNFKPASVIMEESSRLYSEAAKNFPEITDKAVNERVKEAIQQTLDFGEGEGEILESASGKPIQQSLFDEENAETSDHLRRDTGLRKLRNSKEIGFALTRSLINEGAVDLTGKQVKTAKDLAEIAQVLRHPGYEKLHYVYVKNGHIVLHETTTTRLPNVSNALIKGETGNAFAKRLNDNLFKSQADAFYVIHNHPSGDITPSQEDKNFTNYLAYPLRGNSRIKFGGHIILDTTKCSIIHSNGRVYEHDIPADAQIRYADNPDMPHIVLGTKVNSIDVLQDISKKLADQSVTTAFFVDNKARIRSVVQLPAEFTSLKPDRMNRYLRWLARKSYSAYTFITTGSRDAYDALKPLYHQGSGVVDVYLTADRTNMGQLEDRANDFNFRNFFGIGGDTQATKVLEDTTEYNPESTRKGASSMPENNTRYSIRQKAADAVNKLAKPEEKHYGNNTTGFGKVTQQVASRQEKTKFGELIDALRDTYRSLVDEDTHAHKVDEAIQKRTGKELSEDEKFYNGVRLAGNIAKGHAEWLLAGDKGHGETVKARIKKDVLKQQFNTEATMKNVLDIVNEDKMNGKYGDFLKKHNMRDWTQVLETHLAAWRLKEMYNLHMQEWREEHIKWRTERDAARARGEAFRKKEPKYEPYKLPGNLTYNDLNAAIKAAPAEVEKAAQLYYAFNKNLTILLADAGLISGDNYKLLNSKYQRYCPLMRDFSDTAAADDFITGLTRGGDGPTNVSNPLKRISKEGSYRGLLSPLESTIKACAIYCDRAERNKVGQNAVALAEKHKLDDMIWRAEGKTAADAKNCIFTVMQDGKKVAYQCIPELYEPIVGCSEDGANMVLNLMSVPARMLRTGATISPTFAIRNMIRDTLFAGIASKNGFIPIYDTIRGWYTLSNNPEMRAKFEAMGVGMYTFYGNEMSANRKLGDLKVEKPDTLVGWVKELLNNAAHLRAKGTAMTAWEAMEWFSERSEQSTRMGEFQRALANGKSLEEAARDARNLTIDFSRHGRYGKYVNQVVPFFNACVQGGDLMVRLMRKDPVGTTAKLIKYIVLPSVALWAINHDDDWWKELDPELKNSSWFVKTPAGIVRIPKPQEAGVLFGSGAEALLDQAFNRDPDAMKNWLHAFADAIKPNIVPTVFLPILENMANFSYFRMQPIVSRKNENKPGEQQYSNGTSELSKMLGASAVAHAYNKGGYSPSKIDNFIRGYTGTMGMLLWQGAGELANKARGVDKQSPDKKWTEMPFAREFFANSYNLNRSLDEFYDMAAAAETFHNGYGKKGKPSAAVVSVRKARSLISDARKDIQKITDSRTLSPERKRELIDKRQEKIKRIAKIALEKYRDKF